MSKEKSIPLLEKFEERKEELLKKYFEGSAKLKKKIEKLDRTIADLKEKEKAKEKELAGDRADYLKLIADHEKKIEKRIQEEEKKKEKIRKGELRLYETTFEESREIRIRMRSEFREKMIPLMEGIRKKIADKWRIQLERKKAEWQKKVSTAGKLEYFAKSLERLTETAKKFAPLTGYADVLHREIVAIENDLMMYEKGAHVFPRSFPIESMEDLECLVADPRIQDRYLNALDEKIQELRSRGFDFKDYFLTVAYRSAPGDPDGHSAFTWNEIRRSTTERKIHTMNEPEKRIRKKLKELGDL